MPPTDLPIGFVTLGDHLPDPSTGQRGSEADRFRQFVELGVLAEELGYASYHVGEHHFCDYVLSSPTPVLAAVAERTTRILLSTAVTLLPHHDPLRIAEDYATVDVLSGGRVEIIAGRGVFRQHYRQFGQDPDASEQLLIEAIELLRRLWTEEQVSWQGSLRAPLEGVTVHPRPVQQPHPTIWVSATSHASVSRAVALGCPIAIATISTGKDLPAELARAYREQWVAAGRDPADAKVILHVHGYVGGGTTAEARQRWLPHQTSYLQWVLDEVRGPGLALPGPWATLDGPDAQAVCGDAEDVARELADRILAMGGVDRLLVQSDQGGLPFEEVAASMARFAEDVRPRLASLLAGGELTRLGG
jgi:alkanesulfonate monooxygenase SsuD/methylene tetrahydromethanopterin reductase-like flavin-dependent oxidoreductase (luciferase family)